VRVGFVVTAAMGGLGVLLYGALWVVLPADAGFAVDTPGAESAARGGRRPRTMRRLADAGPAIALGALGIGAALTLDIAFGFGGLFWQVVLAGAGVALLWRQADEAQRDRWRDAGGRIDPVKLIVGGGWGSWARILVGVGLLGVAALLLIARSGTVWGSLMATALVVVALLIVGFPWVHRIGADLSAEREERIRTQERADVAAHLHDSVLQTLALIQKSSGDSATVARLARSQERDLRAWLYAGESTTPDTFAGALRGAAAEVEDAHGIAVDVVVVGDLPYCDEVRTVVAATREAMVNAEIGRAHV
jgi:signal transduction histidine kinase